MDHHSPKRQQPSNRRRRSLPRSTPLMLLAAVIAVSLVVGLTWNAAAKYIKENNREAVAKALEFYFTSDLLGPTTELYTLSPGQDGTVDVSFELRNYDGLNNSELDISYTVDVTKVDADTGTEQALDTETVQYLNSDTNHSISISEKKETVTLKGLKAGKKYTVTVTGTNGYSKTLSATFQVENPAADIFYNIRNFGGDYFLVTVWTEGISGSVSINVPDGLIPDGTNSALKGLGAGDTVSVPLDAYESRSYRFFITSDYMGDAMGSLLQINGATEKALS